MDKRRFDLNIRSCSEQFYFFALISPFFANENSAVFRTVFLR